MADLIAQGEDATHRWRRYLPMGERLSLGRTASWCVPWDDRISRVHASMLWDSRTLSIEQADSARNPIFFEGNPASEFHVNPGGSFVIGGTTFTLAAERAFVTVALPQPAEQQSYKVQYLRRHRFRHADERIEILSRLPEVITASAGEFDQHVRLVNLLLAGIPHADASALVVVRSASEAIDVLHWDRRMLTGSDFQPSERLIREAIRTRESIVHVWHATDASTSPATFTAQQGTDWAFCTPIAGEANEGRAIYISGRFAGNPATDSSDPRDLRDDLKFTELAAATLGALGDVQLLERQRAGLSQFFSPVVLAAMASQDPEIVLKPREADVAVLFCDLRGFARTVERSATDLLGLLERVSRALGVTTRQICEHGGVLGDFHGDSVMGFWGWPIAQEDMILRAARAGLAIRAEFVAASQRADNPLANFRVGIGISAGKAVAGKIGTVDQVKVSVFGPVVNLAARLEGMTKTLHAPILLDGLTAAMLRGKLPPEIGRVRRIAKVRPYGMDQALEVCELLPSEREFPLLTQEHLNDYERALDELLAGHWDSAFERLHRVPAEDRVKDFLTMFIVQHNRTAPEGWTGAIPLLTK